MSNKYCHVSVLPVYICNDINIYIFTSIMTYYCRVRLYFIFISVINLYEELVWNQIIQYPQCSLKHEFSDISNFFCLYLHSWPFVSIFITIAFSPSFYILATLPLSLTLHPSSHLRFSSFLSFSLPFLTLSPTVDRSSTYSRAGKTAGAEVRSRSSRESCPESRSQSRWWWQWRMIEWRAGTHTCTHTHTHTHTSRHITSHHITSHHITSHHITSHHITSHHITFQGILHAFTY